MPHPENSDLAQLAQILQFVQPFQQQQQQQAQQQQLMQFHQQQLQQSAQQHTAELAFRQQQFGGEQAYRDKALAQVDTHFGLQQKQQDLADQRQAIWHLAGLGQTAQHQNDSLALDRERLQELQSQNDSELQHRRKQMFLAKQEKDQAMMQHAFEITQHNRLAQQLKRETEAGNVVTQLAHLGDTKSPLFQTSLAAMNPELAQNALELGKASRLATLKGQLGLQLGAAKDAKTRATAIAGLQVGFGDLWDHPDVQAIIKQTPTGDARAAQENPALARALEQYTIANAATKEVQDTTARRLELQNALIAERLRAAGGGGKFGDILAALHKVNAKTGAWGTNYDFFGK